VKSLVDEEIIVISDEKKASVYSEYFPEARVLIDEYQIRAAISGALTGFKNATCEYSILLPCDAPLISPRIISLLLSHVEGNDAVVPKWPNGNIEPLLAVYRTREALKAAVKTVSEGRYRLANMIQQLNVQYLSTEMIKQYDRDLVSFRNINTLKDLDEARDLLRRARVEK
jgi:molybdopterin-guanine dinucleotide biosynthesis protein A